MSLNRSSKKTKVTPPHEPKSQSAKTYLNNNERRGHNRVSDKLVRYKIGGFLNDADANSLSRSGFNLHTALNEELDKRALKQLLQAVVDHDVPKAIRILQCKPKLLLIEPADLGIEEVESQKTWQRFRTEKVFIMAQKLARKFQRPATMTKALLPHFDNIEQIESAGEAKINERKNEKSELEKQWILPSIPEDKEDREQWEEQQKALDTALQRKYINDHFIKLIKTLASDDSIKVKWEQNNITKLWEAKIEDPSKETELAVNALRNMLLPDKAIAIDDNFDIAQLLIAAYNAYDEHFSHEYNSEIYFRNWHQRDAFAVYVIGFIIPLLGGPEVGKKWCRGFYYDVNNISPPAPNPNAEALQLKDGRPFYRVSKSSLAGPGFTFLCDIYGRGSWCGGPTAALREDAGGVGKLCQANASEFGELTRRVHCREEQVAPTQQSRCVIS